LGEIDAWRRRAQAISDAPIREDALDSIARKRANAEGAALFWTLPRHRDLRLLRLLVAYQTTWDYLDSASEHGASAGEANGRELHRALIAALDPSTPDLDFYRLHPWRDDGGYLAALVNACREVCVSLSGYGRVRPLLLQAADRCAVQALNHSLDPHDHDTALKAWAEREDPGRGMPWFELTAAASASVAPHVLLALATEPLQDDEREISRVCTAYFWEALAIAMLDSYADRAEDNATGNHSYIAHYPNTDTATRRLAEIIDQTMRAVRALPNGHRHAVIAACMIAMYLSKDDARTPATLPDTRRLVNAGGTLTRLLLPILRLWRTLYAVRSA
jgi:tetraprenyl-beta-curcumene synthase